MKPYEFIQRINLESRFCNAVLDIIHSDDPCEVKVNRIEVALQRHDEELEIWRKQK